MKIRKLQLKNIGVFDDEEIVFKECPAKDKAEIHILTGENGTGKTTILMALASAFNLYNEFTEENKLFLLGRDINLFSKRFRNNKNNDQLYSFIEVTASTHEIVVYNNSKIQRIISNDEKTSIYLNIRTQELQPRTYGSGNDLSFRRYRLTSSGNSNDLEMTFAAFAYSGYRRIKDEPIEIGKEINENPLYQALDFVKNDTSKFTVNQWLGHNLINSSLAQSKKKPEEVEKFNKKVQTLENVINDIIQEETKDKQIRFEMQSATKLVLIKNNEELDFDVLPDGLKSLISWIGDLLMRLDSLKWENDTPIFEREIILFLDEIEVHLHPAWQRKVLPIVQKLFKNAQIFVSTHSPFVVNSVDDAWVYKLKLDAEGKAKVESVTESEDGYSYETVLREIFDIDKRFGGETQEKLETFLHNSRTIYRQNGNSKISKETFLEEARSLAIESAELQSVVFLELAKISQKTGETYEI